MLSHLAGTGFGQLAENQRDLRDAIVNYYYSFVDVTLAGVSNMLWNHAIGNAINVPQPFSHDSMSGLLLLPHAHQTNESFGSGGLPHLADHQEVLGEGV